jgi:pilus assembly protein CpaC
MNSHRRTRTLALTVALIVIMVAPAIAQAPLAPAPAPAARATNAAATMPVQRVDLLVGRSTVLRTDRPIKRVSLPKPEIADAMVTSPTEVLVHGKMPGTISLLVWGDNGEITTYDVVVRRDLSELEQRVRQLFPGEPILVSTNGEDVVLSGVVSSKYVVDKATSLATGYVEKADRVVNLLRQQEGTASNQVMLRVRFAEVSRSALQEIGASFFTSPTGVENTLGRITTQQFAAPGYDKLEYSKDSSDFGAPVTSAKGEFTFSDFLNLFLFSERYDLGVMVRALQSKGLFQSLAEPNLITQNGKEASFLAGGEYPYPVVQGVGGNAAVALVFKEFGIRLRFTPTVIGNDLIHLKVAPEVSSLDFGNAVTLEGFRVPALSTRRTETEVELRDGQTFAIAGLIDNSLTQTMSKVPGIGDIPVLGYLFRSKAYQKNSTELVVMITPQIVRRDSSGVTSNLPDLVEPYLAPEKKSFAPPAPAFTAPRPTDINAPGSTPTGPGVNVARPAGSAEAVAVPPPSPAPAPKPDRKAEERARREEERKAREDEKKAREAEAKAREDAEVEARRQAEEDKRIAQEQKRQVEEQKKQLVAMRRLQEQQKKDEEAQRKQAAEQQKKLAEQQKRLEEQQRKAAELERRATEPPRRENEQALVIADEQPVPVEPPTAEEAEKRVKKLQEQRAEAERRRADEKKKAQQSAAKKRALSDPYPPLRSRRTW